MAGHWPRPSEARFCKVDSSGGRLRVAVPHSESRCEQGRHWGSGELRRGAAAVGLRGQVEGANFLSLMQ